MRIIKFLLKSLIILAIIGGLGFLVFRELLLYTSLKQLQSDINRVREIDVEQRYATDCMGKGSIKDDKYRVHRTQLRFVDQKNYVLEAVCNQFELSPIEVDQASLPMMVEKRRGSSGLVWGSDRPGLSIEAMGRSGAVLVEEGQVLTRVTPMETVFSQGPVSSCASYGFMCCEINSQSGQGEQRVKVQDCPKTCFESCSDRPLVLNFSTRPYFDRLTRSLEVQSGSEVSFSYTVSPSQEDFFAVAPLAEDADLIERIIWKISRLVSPQSEIDSSVEVELDFGDGQSQVLRDLQGTASHVYTCSRPECEFEAMLKATNTVGATSLSDLDSSIKLTVK